MNIPIESVLSEEEKKEIMDKSAQYSHRALTAVCDIFDEFRTGPHGALIGAQFIGVIAQHMFRMAMGNAFANKNEVEVFGAMCMSAILEGQQLGKKELERQSTSENKETH